MKFDVIFIAGPQGSGKGTQGKKLAERLGFLFWGMGDVLRSLLKEETPLAKKIVAMDQGTLLSDDLIKEVLKDRLSIAPHERGIIFDGVPRTLGQAEFLIPFLQNEGWKKMVTIFFDVPREESMRRLLLRAAHESRVDDTPEAIETRFRYYDETIAPAIEYLKQETEFIEIDGTPAVEDIAANIISKLGIE
jgi:adenylate kinase